VSLPCCHGAGAEEYGGQQQEHMHNGLFPEAAITLFTLGVTGNGIKTDLQGGCITVLEEVLVATGI
jgi:hypothetical protein